MYESTELIEFRREMARRNLARSTIDKRMSVLRRCELAIGRALIDATTDELRDWLDEHRLNAKTRYSYISHLGAFWQWALMEEKAFRNPTLRITRPKLRRYLPRPIPTDDLAVLIACAPTTEIRAMVILASYAGLRCMEIAQLDANDIMRHLNPPVLVVTHGKGDKPRIVPMSILVVDTLQAHGIPAYGPIFHDELGQSYQPWKVSHIVRGHTHACGIAASAHQLRHTFGTEVYRRSKDLRLTQELMGHSSPTTTASYAAWDQEHAAEIVDQLFTRPVADTA